MLGLLSFEDYSNKPPSNWTTHSRGNPALRDTGVTAGEVRPLSRLVAGLPGASACLDDVRERVGIALTVVRAEAPISRDRNAFRVPSTDLKLAMPPRPSV